LLQAVAGLLPATSGSVYLTGTPSLLGVNAALIKKLSGERNILIGGLALGLSRREIESRFEEIVDFAGIGDFVELPMNTYSSGMAARLRFAISTAAVPDVLMIDEALATGDAAFRQRSKERIEQIRHDAGTVFFVSHSLASVRAMCTRAIWLDKGIIRADGPVDEIADRYAAFVAGLRSAGKDDRDDGQEAPLARAGRDEHRGSQAPSRQPPAAAGERRARRAPLPAGAPLAAGRRGRRARSATAPRRAAPTRGAPRPCPSPRSRSAGSAPKGIARRAHRARRSPSRAPASRAPRSS